MRTCVLSLALFGAAILGRAQAPCGADEVHAKAMEENPTYAMGFQASNAAWLNAPVATDTNEVVIPVVFHVIHTGAPYGQQENITDEQIQSAVVALNEDFGNASGEGFDTGISFVLACRDPSGDPTNGILRVDGSAVAGYGSQGIAHAGSANGADEGDVKSLSTWPTESYINVWVVSEINDNDGGGGVQAYAAIGVSGGASDGVTIMHNLVGTVGTLKATDGLNKTMAHEFGHHLNLLHTFNDTYSCQPESNCQVQGDGVCDTPPTVENGGCNSPNCPGALIENLMDYTPNSCKTGFTQGQSDRMWTCLAHQRPGLLNSLGGVPVVAKDLALEALDGAMGCGDGYAPKVRVINQGEGLATGWKRDVRADGEWAGSYKEENTGGFRRKPNVGIPSAHLGLGQPPTPVRSRMGGRWLAAKRSRGADGVSRTPGELVVDGANRLFCHANELGVVGLLGVCVGARGRAIDRLFRVSIRLVLGARLLLLGGAGCRRRWLAVGRGPFC